MQQYARDGASPASYLGQERVIQEAPFCPISGVRDSKCSNTSGMVPVQPVLGQERVIQEEPFCPISGERY